MALRVSDLTDEDIVLSILEHPSKLDAGERAAFEGMCQAVQRGGRLSPKQKAWARRVFDTLGCIKTFNAENLASAMKASGTKVDASTKTKLDAMMGPKPVIPPPRPRPRWDA